MAQLKDLLVTGPVRLLSDVVLGHDPTAALHAATKQYVDASAGKLTVGALTSGTTYYPILATGTGTATRQIDSSLPGFTYVKTNGTTGVEGTAVLSLGNTTASGTAGNASGRLAFYDYSGKKATILPRAVTSHTVDTALYLPDWGTSTSTYLVATTTTNAVGSSTVPVYIDAKGIIQQCSTYAGGTRIVLNDTDRAGGYVSFYAPSGFGYAGQVLESAGYKKAPSWRSFMSYLYERQDEPIVVSEAQFIVPGDPPDYEYPYQFYGSMTMEQLPAVGAEMDIQIVRYGDYEHYQLSQDEPGASYTYSDDDISVYVTWSTSSPPGYAIEGEISQNIEEITISAIRQTEVWDINSNYRALWEHLYSEQGLNLTAVTVYNGYIEDRGWTIDSLLQDAADTSHVLVALDPTNNLILTFDSYSSSNYYKSCTFSTIRNNIKYTWLVEWNSSSTQTYGSYTNSPIGAHPVSLNTNGITTLKPNSTLYPYRLAFTSTDGTRLVPINTSSSSSATSTKTITTTPIDPFGPIYYYDNTSSYNSYTAIPGNYLYLTASFDLRYSYYSSTTPTSYAPIYLKCAYNSSGQCLINTTTPFVYALPTTADSSLYILIGYHASTGNDILIANHPIYYYSATEGRVVPFKSGGGAGLKCYKIELPVIGEDMDGTFQVTIKPIVTYTVRSYNTEFYYFLMRQESCTFKFETHDQDCYAYYWDGTEWSPNVVDSFHEYYVSEYSVHDVTGMTQAQAESYLTVESVTL